MKKLFTCVLILVFSTELFAQFEFQTMSGRGRALGGVSSTLTDFWSGISNISGLTVCESLTLGVAIQNQFLLKELSSKSIAAAFPIKKTKGVLGVNYFHSGTSIYNEQKAGLAYAQQFGKNLSIGLQLDYMFSGSTYAYYENEQFFTFELGAQYKITDEISAGFHVFNPIPTKRVDKEDIPAIIKIGFSYKIVEQLLAAIELEKNMLESQMLRVGLEYAFIKSMFVRAGISTNPTTYTFGYGLRYSGFTLDISGQVHSVLGFSPALSIYYNF